MTPVEELIQIATAELDYCEKKNGDLRYLFRKRANAGYNNYTKYAYDLDKLGVYHAAKQGLSWCDIFVDWCFVQAFGRDVAIRITGQPMHGYGAGCTESANYYKAMGRLYYKDPQPGDQVFYSHDGGVTQAHTGIVIDVWNGRLYTIEGNTSRSSGVDDNGGEVCKKDYALTYSKIACYGRPRYDLVKMEEEEEDMTGKEIWDKLDEYMRGQTMPEKVVPEFQEAIALKLTDGSNPTALTPAWRAAVMAVRAYHKAYDKALEDIRKELKS